MGTGAERLWDGYAASFDDDPDHGLHDTRIRDAWEALLLPLLPEPSGRVADLGCGTGSLAVLLATHGYEVSGLDISGNMLDLARAKARSAEVDVDLIHGDASDPPLAAGAFDVVLARHVLWALEEPAAALERWLRLLAPDGRLILIEGHWATDSAQTNVARWCCGIDRPQSSNN
jgi:ubiquinone/menaquinone biosynthesis C-methylase UbiE